MRSKLVVKRWAFAYPGLVCMLGALVFVGCGESEQAKAEKTVCEAKTEISAGVEGLSNQTIQTVNVTQVKSDVSKISSGLQKLGQAESKLSGTRKAQVQQANAELSSDLNSLKQQLTSLSLDELKTQLTAGVQKLAEGYKRALAPIEC